MKKLLLCSSLFLCAHLSALPEGGEVAAGDVAFIAAEKKLTIEASDKAIINYAKFHIGRGESVEFVQPSSKATVLNRVKGQDKSKILGELKGNGRVFLVNPNGIYFGPQASVNVGSFVASTLDILDDDFLQDRFQFFMQSGSEGAKIVNKGAIRAEESVALFAPYICNSGSVLARAGKVVLAAAEKVTLDFSGDGLIQFTAEGALRNALIEQYGQIEAGGGAIELSMYLAKRAIKMVVNTEGIAPANTIEEVDGIIRLEHRSIMTADQVIVDGGAGVAVEVEGEIKGKDVRITGDVVRQSGSFIDVSSDEGGGTVLIGGDFRGEGELYHATHNLMDEDAVIKADATVEGNGGRVILWADQILDFDGIISVRGGPEGGDGGLVETSVAGEPPSSQTGHVDALAPKGQVGEWLIDPSTIVIDNAGAATLGQVADCISATARTINVTTINGSAANVVLCAQTSITLNAGSPINMTTAGRGVAFRASATGASAITTTLGDNITTNGGAVTFDLEAGATSNSVLLNAATVQITTGSGAAIIFNATVDSSGGTRDLTLSSGASQMQFLGAIGNSSALGALTITNSGALTVGSSLNAASLTQTNAAAGATIFSGAVTVGSATLKGSTFAVNNSFAATGAVAVTNSGLFTKGATGAISAPGGFSTTGNVSLANSITTTNTALTIGGTLTLAESKTVTLTSGSGPLTLSNTADGTAGIAGETLILDAAGGTINLAAVGSGGFSSLTAVTITNSAALNFNGAVNIVGALTQTNAATGATTFSSTVAVGSATLRGTTFAVNNSLTATGAVAVTNSGLFTKGATGAISATGGFSTTGNVSLANNITTTNTALTIGGTLTVAEAASVTLTSGSGALTLSNTVDGTGGGAGETLILNAAGGTINLAAVGSGDSTQLTAVTITNSGALNFNGAVNITGALTQTNAATGATTFSNTVSIGSATLRGTSYNVNNSLTSTGAIAVTNSGLFTKNATGTINAPGGFSTTGNVSLANNITTTNTALTIGGTLTIAEGGTITLTSGSGALTLSNTANGTAGGAGETLILNAAGGVINLAAIGSGSSTSLTTVTVTNSAAINFNGAINITGALTQTNAATGATTFSSTVAVGSATLRGTTFAVNNSFTATGAVAITNSGLLTKGATGAIVATGGFSAIGDVSLANNITTTNTALTIGGTLTLAEGTTITLTSGSGHLTLVSAVDGTGGGVGETLILNAAGGGIDLAAVGSGSSTRLTTVTITNSDAINFNGAVNITGALTQTNAATAVTAFNSTVSVGSATLRGTSYNVTNSLTSTGAIAVTNSGLFTKGATGTINAAGGLSISGASNLGATVTTTGGAISLTGPVTMSGSGGSFDTTNGGGTPGGASITFGSTLNGAFATVVNGGTGGSVSFTGAIGNITPLTSLTVTGATVTQSSTAHAVGALLYTGPLGITIGNTTTTNGAVITLTGPVTVSGNPTFDTTNLGSVPAGATVTFSGTLNGATGVTLRAGTGGNAVFGGAVGGVTPLTALTFTSANEIRIADNITLSGASDLTFPFPVIATGISTITSTNKNITFNTTIDGDAALTRTFRCAAGTGSVVFSGVVGGVNPLSVFGITSANNVTATTITAGSLQQNAGSGTSTFNGTVNTSAAGGISLTGTAFTFNNTVTTTGSGGMTVANSGLLSIPTAATLTISGAFAQTGAGSVQSGNTISAAGIQFTGPVALTSAASYATTSNLALSFNSTINSVSTTHIDLTLNAGSGNITILGNIGSIHPLGTLLYVMAGNATTQGTVADAITLTSGTGLVTTNGDLVVGAGGIHITGNNFAGFGNITVVGDVVLNNSGTVTRAPNKTTTIGGNFSVIGSGPTFAGSGVTVGGNILFVPPVTLAADAIIDTSAGGGTVTFNNTINGARNLTFVAGASPITLSGNLGFLVPLGNLTFTGGSTISTQGIQAASITQTAGTGTTTFNGALTVSGPISVSTVSVVRGAAVTTTALGAMTVTLNGGSFTSTAAGAINLAGAFTQNGTGTVSFGGSLTTANANISFNQQVALASPTTLSSGSGAGDITLSQGAQGATTLVLTSGTGNITLGAGVGTSTALTGFTITQANTVSTQAVTATFIAQNAGTGTTTFNGAVNTTGASGIALTGNNFTFSNTFTTAGGGAVTIVDAGVATFNGVGSVAGAVTVNGAAFASTITAGGAIAVNGAATVSGTGSLTTQAVNQPITFFSTLNGPGNLTLSSGTATITLSGAAGGATALGNLVVSTVGSLSTQAVTAASITQSAASAGSTSTFNGLLTTTGAISLSGEAFTFLNGTSATSAITVVNAGLLTTTAGKTILGGGGFSQTGAGAVSLAGTVQATNNNVSFASPITLIGDATLNSGTSAGDITTTTVNGNFNLTLTAGRDITFGAVGGGTRIDTLTITSARNVNASAVSAKGITQQAGSGTTFINGDLNTNTSAGIQLTGTNFTRSANITTTNNGSYLISNSGLITAGVGNTTSIDGLYTQTAIGLSSAYNLGGVISARLGISISSPVTLLSNGPNTLPVILDTSGGGGNITVTSTINNDGAAPHTFIVRAGAGDVTLSGAIGGSAPIGPFELGTLQNMTTVAVSAASVQQELGATLTGLANFGGTVTTTAIAGVSLSGNAFTFHNVTTSGGGAVLIVNTGLLTIFSGSTLSLDGTFTQSGAGNVSLGGSITTTNDTISFAGPVTVVASPSLNTGAGIGNITFNSTVNGAGSLSTAAGVGDISFLAAVGQSTPLSSLTAAGATNLSFSSNVALTGLLSTTAITGPTTFSGAVTAGQISLSGGAINLNQPVTTTVGAIAITNTGLLTVSPAAPIQSATSFIQTGVGGTVSLGANVTTTNFAEASVTDLHGIAANALSFTSPISLTSDVVLDSGGADITISNTVGGAFDLTLIAGAGTITLSSTVGTPRLADFSVTSANNLSIQSVTAQSIQIASVTGTATLLGSLDTNTASGIAVACNNFTTSGTITTTSGGPLTVTNSGIFTATGGSIITLNGGGAFVQNGTGTTHLGGSITTQNAPISHASAVQVLLPSTLTSNNGNITFSSTVDGPACLTLVAGTGAITFVGPVGSTTPLGCLTASGSTITQGSLISTGAVLETGAITLGGGITTSASAITLTGNVTTTAATVVLASSGGPIAITGTINGDVAGRNLTIQAGGGNVTLGGAIGNNTHFSDVTISGNTVSFAGLGNTAPGASGTTSITATTDINFTGASYNNGAQIYTAGSNFNFSAGAPVIVSSTANPITFATGTIQLAPATDLTINTSGGNLTIGNLLGTGRNFTVDTGAGSFNFTQIGAFGSDLNVVTLTASAFSPTPVQGSNVFATTLIVSSTTIIVISTDQLIGPITYNSPVTIIGNINYTCGVAGTITFNQSVDANTAGVDSLNFDFNPCGGSLIFNGPVGASKPLASITVNAATDVTANAPVFLGSFLETGGLGTAAIKAGMTSTAVSGILITSANIQLASSIATASNGPLIVTNSGTLTIDPGTSLNISGAFQQLGGGSVSMGGSLTTHDNPIQFADPITLSSATSLSSKSATGADIIFSSTIDGAQSFTLLSGIGDIFFSGVVGGGTPLDSLQITQAHDVTASAAISAKTMTQLAGNGTSTFDQLNTTTISGIHLTGSAFTFNNDITTTNSGPLVLTNSGLATFGNHVYTLDGGLTQTGAGTNSVTGSFTSNGNVAFGSAVALTNTTSIDTSAAGRNVTFSGAISGAFPLTLVAGTGNITFASAVSSIGALTITSVNDWSTVALSAASITQSAGSGATTIAGNITTAGATLLTGTNFTINSPTTAIGAAFTIANTGPLSLTLGNTTSIGGAFTQSGGGSVTLAGKVQTAAQNISFADPITLSGSATLTTGAGPGDITLTGAVNGTQDLHLSAIGGSINFGSTLGVTTPLGNLTVVDVNGITYPEIHAASIVQQASSGTTTITGPFTTTGTGGVSITGSVIDQNGTITTTGTGGVTFVNSGLLTVGVGVNTMAAGNYSQSGGGSVSLGGFVTVTDGAISFANPVDLTANVDLVSGVTSSNSNGITLSSAVTGAFNLNLTAVGGSITCSASVGTLGTPLTAFTIVTTDSASTQNIFANTITQQVGTGTSTFNGTLTANTIALTGTGFAFKAAITTAGAFTLTNSGLATFDAAATGTIGAAFLQNGSGTTQLSSTITASGAIVFTGPVTAVGVGTLDTQAANQPITFHSTVNGPGGLTLAPGTADITFDTLAGFTTRLGALNIPLVGNLTLRSVRAASIIQLLQSPGAQTTFNGTVDTNGASGISLAGENFLFADNVTTTGGGNFSISHAGFFNTAVGKAFSISGSFTDAGAPASTVSLGSNITTSNANLQFTGAPTVTLTAPISLNSGAGVGDISFAAGVVVKGHFPLTLTAGLGDITVSGPWTTLPLLGAVTIVSADDVQFQAVSVDSFAQQAGTGTTTISGALTTSDPAGVSLVGNNFTLTTSVITTSGGSLTVTNQGTLTMPPTTTLDGAFTQNGPGPVSLRSVTARLGISCTGAVTIPIAAITLNTSAGTGGVSFASTFDGASAVTITAGSGNVTFSQAIGSITPLTSISATGVGISVANIGTTPTAGVAGSTTLTSTGDLRFTGTIYHANAQTYTATTPFSLQAGALTTFSSGGSVMTFTGPSLLLSTGTDLTMNTGGAALTLGPVHAQAGNLRTLIFNTTAAALQIGAIGTSGNSEFASTTFTCGNLTLASVFSNSITFSYTGTLNAGGNLVTVDTPLLFPAPVNLTGVDTFSTVGTTGANITFSSTVNSAVANAFGFILQAGTGDITFSASVGAVRRLGTVAIPSAHNVTLAALQSLNATALIQQSGTGTTTFNGPVIIPGPLGIQLTGNNFNLPSTVQTLNNASLLVNNSGTLTFSGTGTISGGVTQSTGPMTFSGTITAGQVVTLGGPLTLSGTPSISTAATNQSININNTVGGSGALTLAAGSGGDITFLANVGSSSAYIGNLTVSSYHALTVPSVFANQVSATTVSATGVMIATGSLNTQGAAGIQLTGHDFQFSDALNTTGGGSVAITNSGALTHVSTTPSVIAGSYTQTGAGSVTFGTTLTTTNGTIAFASPVTLSADTSLDSSAGSQNITFSSTIDGSNSLLLTAGGGDITVSQPIGSDLPLTLFTVASAHDIQLSDVGTTAIGVTSTMSLTVSHDINLQSTVYSAGTQIYAPGNRTNLNAGALTALTTSGGPITMTTGEVHMTTSSSLQVLTNNGDFAFTTLTGTTLEDVSVNTGTGLAALATVSSPGAIGSFSVLAGRVVFAGPIDPNSVNIVSQTDIMNIGPAVLIQTPGNASFNALNGDVGTIASPILVQAGGFIFAGAGGRPDSLAVFDGTSSDNSVHAIPTNPPCTIIFNGVVIKQCTLPTPSGGGGGGAGQGSRFPFPMPGADSSFFNWASDYYFFPYLFTERFVKRSVPIYSRAG